MGGRGLYTVLQLLGIGWYVALSIAGFAYGGYWLDRWLDLTPVLTLAGLGVGVAIALVGMYRMLLAVLSATSGPGEEGKS